MTKELEQMRADEKRIANDKLKYPKITGRTYPQKSAWEKLVAMKVKSQDFNYERDEAMRLLTLSEHSEYR